MSVMVKNKQLLKNYSKTWKKIERLFSINFNSATTYGDDDKYIKTTTTKNSDIIITNFHIESDEKCYTQTFLEECKYIQEKIKFANYIDEELDNDSDD